MDLKSRVLENDNRFTALPYLLLLQEKVKYVTKEGYGNNTKKVYVELISHDYVEFDTIKDLREWINDGVETYDQLSDVIEGKHYEEHYMDYYWKTVNVFLTDIGVEEHLDKNRHNLGEHRTFGIHAFRNDEIREVYDLIQTSRGNINESKDQEVK